MPKLPEIDETAGILDEVQAWFLVKAEQEGWVYTSVLRQLVNRLYRDRDYQEKRKTHGRHTAYDYALDRDQKALAWAIRALVLYTPAREKDRAEPPRRPAKPARRLSQAERKRYKGRPSWNGKPKRDWDGPDLPPPSVSSLQTPPYADSAESTDSIDWEDFGTGADAGPWKSFPLPSDPDATTS